MRAKHGEACESLPDMFLPKDTAHRIRSFGRSHPEGMPEIEFTLRKSRESGMTTRTNIVVDRTESIIRCLLTHTSDDHRFPLSKVRMS
jgi:hypothetical protein